MLGLEDNATLTQVGPGTPMGDLIRQYWMPAVRSDELATPDCPPMRLRILGENLISFRATSGVVGIIQNACPHRGASMFFGRNEDDGLRCVYHGWKFDVNGNCIDMPSEPAESNFRNKVRTVAYPTYERGGIVWVYMGPREVPPSLPTLSTNVEGHNSQISTFMRPCNFMQALEGDIDTTHLQFLHSVLDADPLPGTFDYYLYRDKAPRYDVRDTDYGAIYGTWRAAEEDTNYWRIGQWLFPFFTQPPVGLLDQEGRRAYRCWVPLDDDHSMLWNIGLGGVRAPAEGQGNGRVRRKGGKPSPFANRPDVGGPNLFASAFKPNSSDWLGRWNLNDGPDNDFGIDRELQRTESYTGVSNIHLQDEMVTVSMGPVYQRHQEHLGTSDAMVIRVRRRLLAAARALADAGVVPPGVDEPEVYLTRAGGIILPRSVDWMTATEDMRRASLSDPIPTPVQVPAAGS